MKFKINSIRSLVFFAALLFAELTFAQQDPTFTQYNFNTQTINPAYAGTWENLGFTLLGRHQWVGMDGAPTTYTLSVQSLLKNEKVGLGINLVSDQIGKERRLSLYGDYTYGFPISSSAMFRLGVKAGVTNYHNNLMDYNQFPGSSDPAAQGEVDIRYMPNFGVGALLYSDKYYVGLSVPKLIENEFKDNYNNYSTQAELRHFFLIAGYVFNLSESLKFKPTFLTKVTMGAPVQFDLTANFLLSERVWLGAMYRTGDSFGFIAQWIFDKKLRLGYSVDFTTSKLQSYHNGTHEIMISYELGLRTRWTSPRMF